MRMRDPEEGILLFYSHLKETECRFNHRRDDLYHVILKLLRDKPI